MSEPDYRKMLENWAADIIKKKREKQKEGETWFSSLDSTGRDLNELGLNRDANVSAFDSNNRDSNNTTDTNNTNNIGSAEPNVATLTESELNLADPNLLTVPGPYGPAWPYIAEPVEFEIGDCHVKIEMEDENAKFPVGWSVLEDEKYKRESDASVSTFCEWMGFAPDRIVELEKQFSEVRNIKPFKVEFQPQTTKVLNKNTAARPQRGNRPNRQIATYNNVTLAPSQQITKQARDFSRLFHSSVIDTDMLARPTIISEKRKESALKYMSLWGTTQVNVNTAPRQVLEAAFTFGGQAQRIADEIIKRRQKQPFESIAQLKTDLLPYSDNIEKCIPFINTTSNVFTIHVTATSGTARASAVIVVFQVDGKPETVAIVCG
ncbi:MAG: type II secretion system protein GspK [Sedimentisphaerales bacterium]